MPHGPPSHICSVQCRVVARYQQTGVGDPSGRLIGKAALRVYFEEALQELTDVRLDLQVSGDSSTCSRSPAAVGGLTQPCGCSRQA